MQLYETGRICVKTAGREAGSYCVVVDEMDENYVMVTGPKHISSVRRRACNIKHLEPLEEMLDIEKGADDDEVLEALESAELIEQFRSKIRML
ncbi:MAG: 50S ribosomal protein L14e [Candidatus Lokiarchaeota archaeon]|jgi:large subunit ribosomal protein L14e|nr:50S ribosomal protein L14e [Candidatus Lokiarchaeota archaeon]